MVSHSLLTGSRLKVLRAKKHVQELEDEIRAFHESKPYTVVKEEEPESGDDVYRVTISLQIPSNLALIVGDVLSNLRSSLDHLAWDLVIANGGAPSVSTGFPIKRDAKELESFIIGKVSGASSKAHRIIRLLKPYQGGNKQLWRINHLRNVDQHRLLLVVGAAHKNIVIRMMMPSAFGDGEDVEFPPFALNPADRQFPLQDGVEVFRVKAAAKKNTTIQHDWKFTFEIAFGEGEIVQGEPVLSTLQHLIDFTERVINIFDRYL
jgi:hypothetical protein